MEVTPHKHHGLDYIELVVTDTAAAKSFYGAAFGWTFNEYGPGYLGYSDGRPGEAGGLRLEERLAPPLVVLYSSALEKTRDSVVAAGGKIVKDIFPFPGGRRFEFQDPAGNLLGVWSER